MEAPFEKRMKFLEDEESDEHGELQQRLKKTLYYGKMKYTEYQSLAMTELAVEFLQELVPKELGRVDMYWASSLARDVSITPCALMLALMYLKRLQHNNSQYLNQVSSSDLFLISVLVASKYLYDEGEPDDVSNAQYAALANVDVEDVNDNERAFLHAMDWKIFVRPGDFWSFLQILEQKVAWKMSLKRNSFTYTDMSVIISANALNQIMYDVWLELCKVTAVCLTAYVGCVLTLCMSNMIPAIVFSHTFVPPLSSPEVRVVAGITPTVPSPATLFRCPSDCILVAKRAPERSLDRLVNGNRNLNVISNPDIPQICEPWSRSWSPKVCVHASACITVALIQEIASFGYNVLFSSLISFKSFATETSQRIQENLSHVQGHGLCSPEIQRCNQHERYKNGPRDVGQLSSSASDNSSSACVVTSSSVECAKAAKSEEAGIGQQESLYCTERFGSLCWDTTRLTDQAASMSHNFSQTFPSLFPSSNLVQVLGY